jgi:hypothetical protein
LPAPSFEGEARPVKTRTSVVSACGAALLALALPAAAAGATLTSTAACPRIVDDQPTFRLNGTGFTPNTPVQFKAGDTLLGTVTSDAAGNAGGDFEAPELSSRARNKQTFPFLAGDAAGIITPPVSLPVVRIIVDLPDRARPTSRVRYRVYGFGDNEPVYLHVRRGGRTRGTFKIGTAAPPCGQTERRLRFMPLRSYSTGSYEYWFQQVARFDRAQPAYRVAISITRTFRPSGSAATVATAAALG